MTDADLDPLGCMPIAWSVIRRMFPAGERDRRVRRAGGLDELAQEAFLALCDAASTHDAARATWTTWAWHKVRWRLLMLCRKGAVRDRLLVRPGPRRLALLAGPPPAGPDHDDLEAVRSAVAVLSPARRDAVEAFLSGTMAAHARATGRDPSTLRRNWAAAVLQCRQHLTCRGCLP
jgi:DNA-directed RNA polymerase specialized sigma24 family protein